MKNRVGLGTFPLASVFNPISKEDAINLVRQFIDAGGYYIDTAPLYGFGSVEELLGEALVNYPREKYYMISKCGYIDVEGKTFQTVKKSGKYKDVIQECERSLKRLKLDYLDLYFTHSPDPTVPFEETVRALTKLQDEGKIKEIGVSNVNLDELHKYNQTNKVKYIQNRFSLINRSIDLEFRKYLIRENIGLIPYQVIDRGQLTGSIFEGLQNLKGTDLRIGRSDWEEDKVNLIGEWVKAEISPIAKELKLTIGQLSIAWALHQEYLSFVIVGLTNPEYIPINLKADTVSLSEEVLARIDKAYVSLENIIKRQYGMSLREFRGLNEKYY
jgi:aryl-alcohol dehydrogenase-like predicted oxidoreductase